MIVMILSELVEALYDMGSLRVQPRGEARWVSQLFHFNHYREVGRGDPGGWDQSGIGPVQSGFRFRAPHQPMSHLGHSRRFMTTGSMSALPSIATEQRTLRIGSLAPKRTSSTTAWCRFCCKSLLKAMCEDDSVSLERFATGADD